MFSRSRISTFTVSGAMSMGTKTFFATTSDVGTLFGACESVMGRPSLDLTNADPPISLREMREEV